MSLDVCPVTAGCPSGPMMKDVISARQQISCFASQGSIRCRTRLLQRQALCTDTNTHRDMTLSLKALTRRNEQNKITSISS